MAEGQMNGLDREHRLSSAIDGAATSAELATLLREAEAAIVDAEQEAVRLRESAFDPQLAPDPVQARDQMESASLMAGRLRTLHARLLRRQGEVSAAERLANWRIQAADLKRERDDLALKLDEHYPAAIAKLVDLFTQMTALDAKLSSSIRLDRPE
jgi:hypothetical protein